MPVYFWGGDNPNTAPACHVIQYADWELGLNI